jgi:hypothetical protein
MLKGAQMARKVAQLADFPLRITGKVNLNG